MKNTVKIVTMVVMLTTMALISAQKVSAQTPISSRSDLEQLFSGGAKLPYYVVAHMSTLDDTTYGAASTLATIGRLRQIDGAYYYAASGMLWIATETKFGRRGLTVMFYATKESALNDMSYEEGIDKFGPFETGTTSAAQKAAIQRIQTSVQSYKETGILPEKW